MNVLLLYPKFPDTFWSFKHALKFIHKRASLNWRSVMAFVHANFRLGVLGRERFHYWGLLLWTFVRRSSQLSLAVTLSIYGLHFRKVSRACSR